MRFFFLCFLSVFCLQRSLYSADSSGYAPLYGGTLLAFFAENIAPGHLLLEPYLFATVKPGSYGKNWKFQKQKTVDALSVLLIAETGITKYVDITILLTAAYARVGQRDSVLYADTPVSLGLQILWDQKDSWIPDLRLIFGETFPTGKYDHLNPQKLLSDSLGAGAYQTSLALVTAKTFYVFPRHPFNLNLNLAYSLSTAANVHGFNVYGGAANTKGKVQPGDEFLVNLALQYSLNRNWVVGMDAHYIHQNASIFSGEPGQLPNGTIPPVGLPSSEQISLAPCIEYNYNEYFAVEGGVWFTVAGRNAGNFFSGVFTVGYEF